MTDFESLRWKMVSHQIAGRGIRQERVLDAMRTVAREAFVPADLAEFAYDDTPLPIEGERTIAQPFVVALMAEVLDLSSHDRVLEIGSGSGYSTAVLSRIAREIYTVESHEGLAELALRRCESLGYTNVYVRHGSESLGWREHAPYDAVVVSGGGPDVPAPLLAQLSIDGRLVIPVGSDPREQEIVRVVRRGYERYERENLGAVRFVPENGAEPRNEAEQPPATIPFARRGRGWARATSRLIRETAEPVSDLEQLDLGPLMERIGESRVVTLGGATHGTAEFRRMCARITRELIQKRGFTIVATEADWADAAQVDRRIRGGGTPAVGGSAFARFPTWMWRNREVRDFVDWLGRYNASFGDSARRVGFHGLDLYGMYASRDLVLRYLDRVDAEAARVARIRFGCLTPWEQDPALYRRAALSRGYADHETAIVARLLDMLEQRFEHALVDGESWLGTGRDRRAVSNAECYYRLMYYATRGSWALRDQHMFETLERLLERFGPESRAVVWQHSSHAGDAAHTEMGARGERNVGMLARQKYGSEAFLIGFGTNSGTVATASEWGGPVKFRQIRESHSQSYGRLFHDADRPAFMLNLRHPERAELREELAEPRLERAIDVIYRPETELRSHYFQASLPLQFDAYVWFDQTHAVTPIPVRERRGEPEIHPFGP
jgi:protein-L-isoaspartate(D-aspartate) O-methyltransferase